MDRTLIQEILEVVEQAAIASARLTGLGKKDEADAAAVEAMRQRMGQIQMQGRIVIGEGERDEAPMLYIGEKLGNQIGNPNVARVDIAVDPLECTNNCADNLPNSIAVLAAAPRGTLLHAPDCYMDKIAAGPEMEGHISLDASVAYNIEQVASVLDKPISEVRVIALDRPRHNNLFREIKELGANLHLLSDGDISAALWAARPEADHDILMGIGAAPEGVITATAIRGIGGVFEGRLVFRSDAEKARAEGMIDDDLSRLWDATDLCKSEDAIFVASGVCDGYLPGVAFAEDGTATTYAEMIDVAAGTIARHDRIHRL